jgi:two-component system response regulator PilR (NtrC family)
MNDQVAPLHGSSPAARALEEDVAAAARSDAKVLITGESGAGKEVAARQIHERGPRRQQGMLALNCAGVPDALLESELFGYVRGSFTGAYRDKPGLLESANGGTVFLDEIGEMSLRMQALLLRFLETGEIQRVGADRPAGRLNVRVLCATNRDLATRIASGEFREDLFYRINVMRIHVPALRERREDLPQFIDHFLAHFAERHRVARPAVSPAAHARLLAYRWPGNLRELRNVIERLVVRAHDGHIDETDLPPEVLRHAPPAGRPPGAPALPPAEALAQARADEVYARMLERRLSFWTEVYDPFMQRDLTRDTLRRILRRGLDHVGGKYHELTPLFNMARADYKRFVNFLRKHDCLVAHEALPGQPPGTARDDARRLA